MCEIYVASAATLTEPLTPEQIEDMPLYEWEVANIGDAAPPFSFTVTEDSIARYCQAVRNDNPLYLDPEAARRGPYGGIIAPPTFIFMCAPARRNEVMHTRGYASPEEKADRATPYAKAEIFFQRPVRPGDEIVSVVRLDEKYERRGNQFMTWHVTAQTAAGENVAEYAYTIIWRQAPARESTGSNGKAAPSPTAPRTGGSPLATVRKVETQEAIDTYGELTRVRPRLSHHSLHSDPDFARRTIFGGTVNMGVATAAYCSESIEQTFGAGALLQPGGRLEYKGIRPIRAGYEITISGTSYPAESGAGRRDCELTVHNQDGTLCGVATATVLA
jgi:acyl dehydratase